MDGLSSLANFEFWAAFIFYLFLVQTLLLCVLLREGRKRDRVDLLNGETGDQNQAIVIFQKLEEGVLSTMEGNVKIKKRRTKKEKEEE